MVIVLYKSIKKRIVFVYFPGLCSSGTAIRPPNNPNAHYRYPSCMEERKLTCSIGTSNRQIFRSYKLILTDAWMADMIDENVKIVYDLYVKQRNTLVGRTRRLSHLQTSRSHHVDHTTNVSEKAYTLIPLNFFFLKNT